METSTSIRGEVSMDSNQRDHETGVAMPARYTINGLPQQGNIWVYHCGDGRLMNFVEAIGIREGRGCWVVRDPGAEFNPGAGATGRRFSVPVNMSRDDDTTLLAMNVAHGAAKHGCLAHGYSNEAAMAVARKNAAIQMEGYGKSRGIGTDKRPFFYAVAVYYDTDTDALTFLPENRPLLSIEELLNRIPGITAEDILNPAESRLGPKFYSKLRKGLARRYSNHYVREDIFQQMVAVGAANAVHVLLVRQKDRDEAELENTADTLIVGFTTSRRRNKYLVLDDADQVKLKSNFLLAISHLHKNHNEGRTKRIRVRIARSYEVWENHQRTREDRWQQVKVVEFLAQYLGDILREHDERARKQGVPEILPLIEFQMRVEARGKRPEPLHPIEQWFRLQYQTA